MFQMNIRNLDKNNKNGLVIDPPRFFLNSKTWSLCWLVTNSIFIILRTISCFPNSIIHSNSIIQLVQIQICGMSYKLKKLKDEASMVR